MSQERPLFSVVIPLEFHRGHWEHAWLGWYEQSVDKSLYEIILVVPPDFSSSEELQALRQLGARLEFADWRHDIGLCAAGATRAHGAYLFFTESHCRPAPDVLALCIRAFADHPDWAGFSCHSVPICHNRLSEAEAEMYQADIEYGMKVHPWLKILDHCFVTRRQVYEQCGGLRAEFGHFAEWVLAANYHARGHTVGYLEEACFHHYYVGKLDELKEFTLDFVRGEIRYFSEGTRDAGRAYLDDPVEWICRDNFDSGLARDILRAALRIGGAGPHAPRFAAKGHAVWRWLAIAACGDALARGAGLIAAVRARCVLLAMLAGGSRQSISHWFKRYIADLIHLWRLNCIHAVRAATDVDAVSGTADCVLAWAGFHALETWSGSSFRWSETEAAIRLRGVRGRNIVRIRSPAIREPLDHIAMRFFLDGEPLTSGVIAVEADTFILDIDLPPSGVASLAWICPRFAAVSDPRRLGLPVASIEIRAV